MNTYFVAQGHFSTDEIYQAQRDPDEEGDYMAFEQLMADAAMKKEKKDSKKDKKEAKKEEAASHHHAEKSEASAAAAGKAG